jgi:endonuclease YncB( thermonuclease family)
MRRTLIGGVALLLVAGGSGAAAATTSTVTSAVAASRTARVLEWVDGDTLRTTRGVVRLIGMDAPEGRAACALAATRSAERLAPVGTTITLIKVPGRDDTDR